MNGTWDEARLVADGFERVLVELEWYDGPRAGVVGVGGAPHYFDGFGQYTGDGAGGYRVWPVAAEAAAWEREQWAIQARWGARPGPDGVDPRYDELTALLAEHRREPEDARLLVGELRNTGAGNDAEGTGHWFRWQL
ncbi:hypothetical protein GCM10009759_19450 [Kitasatospora saccharophila]|uniref:Uncharacterized protein n=1 Tax=Kitasatospora saccharophila TaxID=407973 RepID=A0ABN2WIB2_9ACTN